MKHIQNMGEFTNENSQFIELTPNRLSNILDVYRNNQINYDYYMQGGCHEFALGLGIFINVKGGKPKYYQLDSSVHTIVEYGNMYWDIEGGSYNINDKYENITRISKDEPFIWYLRTEISLIKEKNVDKNVVEEIIEDLQKIDKNME